MSRIKVLLVEDSAVAMSIYENMLDSSPHIEVVGKAANGKEGIALIPQVKPDVICTDLQMPQMDGYEFIKQVMAQYPVPILVLSNAVQKTNVDNIYAAMKAGAVDIMAKPAGNNDSEAVQKELITKIRVLATKKVSAKPLS